MSPSQVQQDLIQFIQEQNFNAPYGVLESQGRSQTGRRYLSITFGRPRTLDAELQIYGAGFIVLRHSRDRFNRSVFNSVEAVKEALTEL